MAHCKFGLAVLGFPTTDGSSGQEYVAQTLANLASVQGQFDSVWVADHFVPTLDFVPDDGATLECWTTTSFLAGAFPQFQYGNIVLCQSYRNPALLAKMAATLQLLTGGRYVLGIGAGWKADEYRAYGYDFPSSATRVRQLAEAVRIARALWTDTPATFHGRYYTVDNAWCEPKPTPPIPVMIGGRGEQLMLRVVAEQADWWNTGGDPAQYAYRLSVLQQHCQAVGRDPATIVQTWFGSVAIGCTEDAARQVAARHRSAAIPPITGTPSQVAARLQEYIAMGVQHFILHFVDFHTGAGLHLFAEKVMPHIRDMESA